MIFQEFPAQEFLEPVTFLTALSRLIADQTVSRRNPKPAPNHPLARATRLGWRPEGVHVKYRRGDLPFIFIDPTAQDVPGRERTLIFHNPEGLECQVSRGGLSLPIPASAYLRAGLPVPLTPMEFALSKFDRCEAADWCTTILNPR